MFQKKGISHMNWTGRTAVHTGERNACAYRLWLIAWLAVVLVVLLVIVLLEINCPSFECMTRRLSCGKAPYSKAGDNFFPNQRSKFVQVRAGFVCACVYLSKTFQFFREQKPHKSTTTVSQHWKHCVREWWSWSTFLSLSLSFIDNAE